MPVTDNSMQRFLVILGVAILALGLAWPLLSKLPLGHLPGDIVIDRPGFRFYLPLTSSLLISALVSFVLWLLRR
ncbi:MAG TPA: DUF2905 domain-containing protein [Steroidobacteraceae bacterium]|nr:DUF2905 domain-containing protein [Steroidobacteraceae bacterium]